MYRDSQLIEVHISVLIIIIWLLPHLNDIITIRHNRTKFLQFLKKNHNEENRNILFNFSFYPNGKSNGTKFHGIEEDFCWNFLDSLGMNHIEDIGTNNFWLKLIAWKIEVFAHAIKFFVNDYYIECAFRKIGIIFDTC